MSTVPKRWRAFTLASALIIMMAAVQVYAIETDKSGGRWVAAVVIVAVLAAAGVLNFYREEWKR